MSPDKLAHMANQIGQFFQSQAHTDAVAAITDHLVKFWDPRMRQAIRAQLDDPGNHLDPLVRQAVGRLPESHPG
jgi:formate dehydrogenase subunit delta